MLYGIIPFSHSLGTEPLLYRGDGGLEVLKIGNIVDIPYGKGRENGIVASVIDEELIGTYLESEQYARIKDIYAIISGKEILAPYQLALIQKLAKKYMIPIHRVLGIFLHTPVLKRLARKNYENLVVQERQQRYSGKENTILLFQDEIVTPENLGSYLKAKTAIILPDEFSMMPYSTFYSSHPDTFFLSDEMTETKKAQAWIDISNGVYNRVFGNRKMLFQNLSQYQYILYIEDALGPDYWHYPIHMDYKDIFRILVENSPLQSFSIITSIPTLTMLSSFRDFSLINKKI